MFTIHRQELTWAGKPLVIETGKIARQSDGAVVVTYGETSVLCTVVGAKKPMEGVDFFPLSVHYQEKYYAAGRIPGGFFKRETKPSEREVLISRLIDRPIRPLFPEGFKNETQVICSLLSFDGETEPDIAALIGASAALRLSGIPFPHTLAAARVGYKDGEYTLNSNIEDHKESLLDIVVAGTKDGVLMVESEAKELSEDVMLGAVMYAHEQFQVVIKAIDDLAKKAGKETWVLEDNSKTDQEIFKAIKKLAEASLTKAYALTVKQDRYAAVGDVFKSVVESLVDPSKPEMTENAIKAQFKKLEQEIVRGGILKTKKRIDGRGLEDIRQIVSEAGFIHRVHGSALFTRGETQALVVTTLGTTQDEQVVDGIMGDFRERFMLNYNFPPYSVGETGRMGAPGRREIGHGKLAWRALNPVVPPKSEFSYTIRCVSEITESNGSSSMATVCGATLSMLDAGIPLKAPVAGIAMGLIQEGDKFAVLSDILGDEDHLGDMDFKVAGTREGITALQMDIKVTSITKAIMEQALAQAKDGRFHILNEMSQALDAPRDAVSEHAPRMTTVKINREKIRDLIGPGGKVIREICETTGAKIDISEEGVVEVSAASDKNLQAALARINAIAMDLEVGMIFKGKVGRILEFGAIVNFMGDRSGMVHISQLVQERVKTVQDVVKEGDEVYVQIIEIEERGGKIKLSMKTLDQTTGEALAS